ncbi:MAG: hypothetical protein EAZ24_16705, partial [Burkholderiales bacterium]
MTSSAREPHIIDAVPERIVREDVRGDARASAEQRAGASQSGHGKGGAAAAVTGLIKDIEENPERFASVTSNRKFQEILKIVKIVAENSA